MLEGVGDTTWDEDMFAHPVIPEGHPPAKMQRQRFAHVADWAFPPHCCIVGADADRGFGRGRRFPL
jgi:hypothetical protein